MAICLSTSSCLRQLVVHPLARSLPDFYPLIRPPRWPYTLEIGRIHIPLSLSISLGGVHRDFSFTGDKTRTYFSHLSGSFGEHWYNN